MCVSVYVNTSGSMCQTRLKQRWNTKKLVKGRQKSKELLPITLIATCRKRLPNIVTLTRVRICESRKDVLRFVTVADRSAAIIFARRIILGFAGFAEHSCLHIRCLHIGETGSTRSPIDIVNDILSLIVNDLARKSRFLNNVIS